MSCYQYVYKHKYIQIWISNKKVIYFFRFYFISVIAENKKSNFKIANKIVVDVNIVLETTYFYSFEQQQNRVIKEHKQPLKVVITVTDDDNNSSSSSKQFKQNCHESLAVSAHQQ